MVILLGLLLTLCVFFIVVFLHELGHFFTARWSGVKVMEFGLGIPPKLFKFFTDKHGTDWTINWLPLGGFVRLKGENYADPDSLNPDAFSQALWWKQMIILLAGVCMNFLLAGCIFAILFMRGTEPLTIHIRELAPDALLSQVGTGTQMIPIFDSREEALASGLIIQHPGIMVNPLPGSPAEKAGLKTADIILSADAFTLQHPEDLSGILRKNSSPITLNVLRGSETLTIDITPIEQKIGAYITPNMTLKQYQYDFFPALYHGMKEVYHQIGFSFRTFGAIIGTYFSSTSSETQKKEATAGIGGPVAIGKVFVGLADHGVELRSILILTAMISLSLGVFNLLPFPALDGGRCLIVIVNQMIHVINPRYKISPKIEQFIHSLGFLILIILSILVTWKDIFVR